MFCRDGICHRPAPQRESEKFPWAVAGEPQFWFLFLIDHRKHTVTRITWAAMIMRYPGVTARVGAEMLIRRRDACMAQSLKHRFGLRS